MRIKSNKSHCKLTVELTVLLSYIAIISHSYRTMCSKLDIPSNQRYSNWQTAEMFVKYCKRNKSLKLVTGSEACSAYMSSRLRGRYINNIMYSTFNLYLLKTHKDL